MPPFSTAKRRTRNSDGCRAPRSASGPENEREPVIRRLFRSKRTRNSAYRKSKLRLRAADSRVKQTSTRTVLKPNAVRPFRDEPARRRISPRRSSSAHGHTRRQPAQITRRRDAQQIAFGLLETVELAQRVRFTRSAQRSEKKRIQRAAKIVGSGNASLVGFGHLLQQIPRTGFHHRAFCPAVPCGKLIARNTRAAQIRPSRDPVNCPASIMRTPAACRHNV